MNHIHTKLSEQAELLGRLYETASAGLPWEPFLRVLAKHFEAHAAQLIYHDTNRHSLRFSATCGLDPDRVVVSRRSVELTPPSGGWPA